MFIIDIKIPDEYPEYPPKMRFISKIWHPNISSEDGTIRLDILENEKKWSSSFTLCKILLKILKMLADPDPFHPLDEMIAKQYRKNSEVFKITAEEWTQMYASTASQEREENVKKLVNMGFDLVFQLINLF